MVVGEKILATNLGFSSHFAHGDSRTWNSWSFLGRSATGAFPWSDSLNNFLGECDVYILYIYIYTIYIYTIYILYIYTLYIYTIYIYTIYILYIYTIYIHTIYIYDKDYIYTHYIYIYTIYILYIYIYIHYIYTIYIYILYIYILYIYILYIYILYIYIYDKDYIYTLYIYILYIHYIYIYYIQYIFRHFHDLIEYCRCFQQRRVNQLTPFLILTWMNIPIFCGWIWSKANIFFLLIISCLNLAIYSLVDQNISPLLLFLMF